MLCKWTFLMPPGDHETWADAMGCELVRHHTSDPRLRVAVGERKHETSHSEPFLALVRPRHGFETAQTKMESPGSVGSRGFPFMCIASGKRPGHSPCRLRPCRA
jgi:hypothetical protein